MDASRIAKEATRLLPVVERVLRQYPIEVVDVDHLTTHSNVMYRVRSRDGRQWVLRVGTPHGNTRSNLEFEVAWLDALHSETSLDVVAPEHTLTGDLIVDELDPEIDKERSCVLFTWIPGNPMGDGAGPFGYRLLGQMSALLQQHGKTWRPPHVGEMRRWDRVFYYDSELDPVVLEDPRYGHLFDDRTLKIIRKAGLLARELLHESWKEADAQVVHGDLHEWNVHISGSRLYAFDFEDVMLALPAQDVAISLYSSRASEQRQVAREAFRTGFETVAEWPIVDESQLDGFHAARQIMLMNYAARTLPLGEATDYLDHVMPWLEGYVRRYG